MYKMEMEKHNNMSAFAYYKNYFDRMTAHLAFVTNFEKDLKKPNYKNFYQEGTLKRFYKGIDDVDQVIHTSHQREMQIRFHIPQQV